MNTVHNNKEVHSKKSTQKNRCHDALHVINFLDNHCHSEDKRCHPQEHGMHWNMRRELKLESGRGENFEFAIHAYRELNSNAQEMLEQV